MSINPWFYAIYREVICFLLVTIFLCGTSLLLTARRVAVEGRAYSCLCGVAEDWAAYPSVISIKDLDSTGMSYFDSLSQLCPC